MIRIPFQHKMAAHCETGSLTASLNHAGLDITEPMVFGIGSGIFFGYFKNRRFPFPIFTVRSRPGEIRKNVAKLLGVKFRSARYKDPAKAQKDLDALLEKNIPVTVQVDFFYMDYSSAHERVHNNMHFVNVIGKNGTKYIVSDSYFPEINEIEEESLIKGRFAKGMMAPKGFMYYTESVPDNINFTTSIIKGIIKAARYMLKLPVPFIGIKGIYRFSDKVVLWPKYARDTEHLSHEVMKIHLLLEDQGTGGGGFRFIYATFLRQAAEILKNEELKNYSEQMMKIGDNWRLISLFAARIGKNRDLGPEKMNELSRMIRERGDEEKVFFNSLYTFAKKFKN
jgi:hypothetical protein